ncbi:hypothetical protein KM043_014894 [Ampulex compressa]|nr:hypothetical protein KM043_014894 [Ampulex compressa]
MEFPGTELHPGHTPGFHGSPGVRGRAKRCRQVPEPRKGFGSGVTQTAAFLRASALGNRDSASIQGKFAGSGGKTEVDEITIDGAIEKTLTIRRVDQHRSAMDTSVKRAVIFQNSAPSRNTLCRRERLVEENTPSNYGQDEFAAAFDRPSKQPGEEGESHCSRSELQEAEVGAKSFQRPLGSGTAILAPGHGLSRFCHVNPTDVPPPSATGPMFKPPAARRRVEAGKYRRATGTSGWWLAGMLDHPLRNLHRAPDPGESKKWTADLEEV